MPRWRAARTDAAVGDASPPCTALGGKMGAKALGKPLPPGGSVTRHLSKRCGSAHATCASHALVAIELAKPPPQPRARERSLPVPSGMTAIGSVEPTSRRSSVHTLLIALSSQPHVPSPPPTSTRQRGMCTNWRSRTSGGGPPSRTRARSHTCASVNHLYMYSITLAPWQPPDRELTKAINGVSVSSSAERLLLPLLADCRRCPQNGLSMTGGDESASRAAAAPRRDTPWLASTTRRSLSPRWTPEAEPADERCDVASSDDTTGGRGETVSSTRRESSRRAARSSAISAACFKICAACASSCRASRPHDGWPSEVSDEAEGGGATQPKAEASGASCCAASGSNGPVDSAGAAKS
jgi:hypothetical protein